jgi:RNA polymerase sporulation-specific sigma factor
MTADETLFLECKQTIAFLCFKYSLKDSAVLDYESLYSEALFVYTKCLKTFDKKKGIKFNSYLHKCISNHFCNILKKEKSNYRHIEKVPLERDQIKEMINVPHTTCTCLNSISDIFNAADLSENARKFLEIIFDPPDELRTILIRNGTAYSPAIVTLMYLSRILNFSFPEIYRIRKEIITVLKQQ